MIITRSPLRITLGGGGTDLPSYYEKYGGFLIAAAINKYVYITVHQAFRHEFIIRYSQMERVKTVEEIAHPIVREAFQLVGIDNDAHLELASMADIPAGTGLGSSGSFTTAVLKALHGYKKNLVHPGELAAQACDVELNRLKEPIGKQDQYIAAFGGITCFEFNPDGSVKAWPLRLSEEIRCDLEDNLLLFFTGYSRSASEILKDQDTKSREMDPAMVENLHYVKTLGIESQAALEAGDLHRFGCLMDTHWRHKRKRSNAMSNDKIDEWYQHAMENGAVGGKLIGAGGGGFLMFYTENKPLLRHAMRACGLTEVRFMFDWEGTKFIAQ
jgi:D-glycero-alpha-D-manno-heptose-7-phosphate kinase